jgi:hypothetical protein
MMPIHVYWKDRNLVLLGCNQWQAEAYGFKSKKDLVGLTHRELISKESSIEEQKKEIVNLNLK